MASGLPIANKMDYGEATTKALARVLNRQSFVIVVRAVYRSITHNYDERKEV